MRGKYFFRRRDFVVAIATQLPTASSGTLSIVLDGTNSSSDDYSSQDPVEYIQGELLSLSLRHAEVQKRIQHLRHALLALVHVFGPEILATSARDSPQQRRVSGRLSGPAIRRHGAR